MEEFGGFSDAAETFSLTMGKQVGDNNDDFDFKRFSGKFKVTFFRVYYFAEIFANRSIWALLEKDLFEEIHIFCYMIFYL